MSASLRGTISQLAHEFAASVLGAVRNSPLGEILEETANAGRRGPGRPRKQPALADFGSPASSASSASAAPRPARGRGKGRRLGRRSAKALGRVVDQIAALLASHPKGLRAEQIRAQLNLSAKEMPRPIAKALESKRITKTGEKRATTYFAGGGGAGAAPKAAKKKAKPSRKGKAKRTARKAGAVARKARRVAKKAGRRRTGARRGRRGGKAPAAAQAARKADKSGDKGGKG